MTFSCDRMILRYELIRSLEARKSNRDLTASATPACGPCNVDSLDEDDDIGRVRLNKGGDVGVDASIARSSSPNGK